MQGIYQSPVFLPVQDIVTDPGGYVDAGSGSNNYCFPATSLTWVDLDLDGYTTLQGDRMLVAPCSIAAEASAGENYARGLISTNPGHTMANIDSIGQAGVFLPLLGDEQQRFLYQVSMDIRLYSWMNDDDIQFLDARPFVGYKLSGSQDTTKKAAKVWLTDYLCGFQHHSTNGVSGSSGTTHFRRIGIDGTIILRPFPRITAFPSGSPSYLDSSNTSTNATHIVFGVRVSCAREFASDAISNAEIQVHGTIRATRIFEPDPGIVLQSH